MPAPDPAERMARVREAMREEDRKLAAAMRNADHNGNPNTEDKEKDQ